MAERIDVSEAQPAKAERLAYVDGFRALAIIFVVLAHMVFLTPHRAWQEPVPLAVLSNVIAGGTPLFVFISGLLFHHVFYRRWNYRQFITDKLKNVFLPYVLVTLFVVVAAPLFYDPPVTLMNNRTGEQITSFYSLFTYALVAGSAGYSMWYLPFIAIIFAASPAFVKFIEAKPGVRAAVLVVGLVIGATVNRPPNNIDKIQTVLYFTFYYLMGIEASIRGRQLVGFLSIRSVPFLLLFLVLAIALFEAVYQGFDGAYGPMFEPAAFDFRYLQKAVLILLCCSACVQISALNTGAMKTLALDSFGIFFVHNPLVMILREIGGAGWSLTGSYTGDMLANGLVVLLLSWGIVRLIKRLFPEHSKQIIGA